MSKFENTSTDQVVKKANQDILPNEEIDENKLKLILKDLKSEYKIAENLDYSLSIWNKVKPCQVNIIKEFITIPHEIVKILDNEGRHKEALEFAKKQSILFQSSLGEDRLDTLKMKNNMALFLLKCGNDSEALKIFEKINIHFLSMGLINEYTLCIQNNIGLTLSEMGKNKEALIVYKKVFTMMKEILGENHPQTLITKNNISVLISKMENKFSDALNILNETLAEQKKNVSINDLEILTTQHNIGSILFEQNNYEKSLEILTEVECKRKIILGPNHLTTLKTSFMVAQVLIRQNKYKKAQNILENILEITIKTLGEEHPLAIQILNEIATVLLLKGQILESQDILRQVFEKQKKSLGINHPLTRMSYSIMRLIKSSNSKTNKEEQLLLLWEHIISDTNNDLLIKTFSWLPNVLIDFFYDDKNFDILFFTSKAVYILKSIAGCNHVNTLIIEGRFAILLCEHGHYRQALEIHDKINKKIEEILGSDNEFTLTMQNCFSLCLLELGFYEKALNNFNKLFIKQKQLFGPDNIHTLCSQSNIARALDKMENYDEAMKVYEDILERERLLFESTNPKLLTTLHNMAATLSRQKKFKKSLDIFNDVYEKRKMVLGEHHLETLITQNNIGRVLFEKGDLKKALTVLNEVYLKRKEILGQDNIFTLKTQSLIGSIYYFQNQYQHALEIFKELHPNLELILGPSHPDVLHNSNIIAEIQIKVYLNNNKMMNYYAKNGNLEEIKLLIKIGGNVNLKDDGYTPLHWACYNDHYNIVKLLLENGADPSQTTIKGTTPLHLATSKGFSRIIDLLLKHSSSKKWINSKTFAENTASLHIAAKNGSLEIVKSLLKHGAIYDIKNKNQQAPLDLSKDQNINDLLKLIQEMFYDVKKGNKEIINKIKKLKTEEFIIVINTHNSENKKLLQMAVISKNKYISKELLKLLK